MESVIYRPSRSHCQVSTISKWLQRSGEKNKAGNKCHIVALHSAFVSVTVYSSEQIRFRNSVSVDICLQNLGSSNQEEREIGCTDSILDHVTVGAHSLPSPVYYYKIGVKRNTKIIENYIQKFFNNVIEWDHYSVIVCMMILPMIKYLQVIHRFSYESIVSITQRGPMYYAMIIINRQWECQFLGKI